LKNEEKKEPSIPKWCTSKKKKGGRKRQLGDVGKGFYVGGDSFLKSDDEWAGEGWCRRLPAILGPESNF